MTAPLPTRQAIENAGDLDFTRPRKDVTIIIHATLDNFTFDVSYIGPMDGLPAAIKRLRELGAVGLGGTSQTPAAPLQRRAAVTYDDDGTPICGNVNCSRHGKPLEPSQHNDGYYCKGKDSKTGNAKGYCRTTTE